MMEDIKKVWRVVWSKMQWHGGPGRPLSMEEKMWYTTQYDLTSSDLDINAIKIF